MMSTPTPTGGISSSSYQGVRRTDRSDGYKNTINNNEQDTEINNNKPYVERFVFNGSSQEIEFQRVTLTVNGDVQQVRIMIKACKAFCNSRGIPSMSQSIEDMKVYDKNYFVKARIDKSNYTNTDDRGHVTIDKSKQYAEIARCQVQLAIEMKQHYQHKNIGATLCNIIWDQSDEGIKAACNNHNNFKKAF